MSSSSERRPPGTGFLNIPAPEGSKAGLSYTRFIPREELGEVQPWQPGSFGAQLRRPGQGEQRTQGPNEQEWLARIDTARQQAYEEGYRDGMAALEGFKRTHTTQMAARVGQLVQSFDAQWAQLEEQMAQALSRGVVLLARQVLRTELGTQPALVQAVATEALNTVLMSARQVLVRVHPDDLPLVAEGAGEALRARGARLQADPNIQRGGCSVESDAGNIDATIENRWGRAVQALGHALPWQAAPLAAAPWPAAQHDPASPTQGADTPPSQA
ncbi:MAG: flagellar assembly protein FliH [Betaproteobacteria bacterium]